MSETKIGKGTNEVEPTVDSLKAALDAYRSDPNEATAEEALAIYDRMGDDGGDGYGELGTQMEAWEGLMDEEVMGGDSSYSDTLSALVAERRGGTFGDDPEEWNDSHYLGAEGADDEEYSDNF
jgi:hypothetical protein